MKIRLTENQYKRLLKENDKDFLDGNVDFKNIGNKIDRFISKLFCILVNNDKYSPKELTTEKLKKVYPFNEGQFNAIFDRIKELGGYTKSETILLTYNYIKLYDTIVSLNEVGNCNNLVGIPLEFYGKFSHYATIQHSMHMFLVILLVAGNFTLRVMMILYINGKMVRLNLVILVTI